MEMLPNLLLIAGVAVAVYVLIKMLLAPIKWIFKFLLNAASGFLLLLLANFISGFFNFTIPVNLITCLIAGIFGIPGTIFIVVALLFIG